MTKYTYAITTHDQQAKAAGREMPISTKQSIEICNQIRGKNINRAKSILDDAISFERAIPFKRFTNGLGHKPGRMASGRYHPKACKLIKELILSAEANALNKGLSVSDLIIKHICVQKAGNQFHMGSRRGIRMRRTHLEVVLEAQQENKKETKKTEKTKPEFPKKEEKVMKKERAASQKAATVAPLPEKKVEGHQ